MEILHDEKEHRFHISLEGGYEAILLYRRVGEALELYHTEVPPESRQRGVAEQLVETAFRYAEAHNLKIIPTCPYISGRFLQKRPEFLRLVLTPSS